jgi:hypothetical protein
LVSAHCDMVPAAAMYWAAASRAIAENSFVHAWVSLRHKHERSMKIVVKSKKRCAYAFRQSPRSERRKDRARNVSWR